MFIVKSIVGFTLLELMIALGIVSIFALIAYPSYQNSILKARRSDAKTGLLALQQAQESFRANCVEYADNIVAAGSGICDSSTADYSVEFNATSNEGYYTFSTMGDVSTYSITATYNDLQSADSDCKTLTIDQEGNKSATDVYDNPSSVCW